MITSLKPINLILFDTYILAILYLAITWKYICCNTSSNVWELFYYLILLVRLLIDELENNSKISKNVYYALLFTSSFVVLNAMCIYESVTIAKNPQHFDDPKHTSSCFQNRILLVGECVFGFLICIKDVFVVIKKKSKDK